MMLDAAIWAAVVDRLVATRLSLGMAVAYAPAEIRDYEAGRALILRVHDEIAAVLRDGRASYVPEIVAACAAVGLEIHDVGFIEREVSR